MYTIDVADRAACNAVAGASSIGGAGSVFGKQARFADSSLVGELSS